LFQEKCIRLEGTSLCTQVDHLLSLVVVAKMQQLHLIPAEDLGLTQQTHDPFLEDFL
jgi:hypothetical protein